MTAVATHEPAAAPAAPRPATPTRSAAPAVSPTAPWSLGAVSVRAPGDAAQEDSWLLDRIADAARSLPGYSLASAALGQDLLTGRPVPGTVGETLETLLTAAGPFGAGVGAALGAFDVLGEAVGAVQRAFAEHRVSVARIGRDVAAAWDRLDVMLGIDGNVAILRGYVDAFLADVRAAVAQVVAGLIAAVRTAVVPLVEPLLADPAIAPAWDLATKVMGTNPLSGVPVAATTAEILAAFLTVIGRVEVLEQMRERGTLQQTADWLDTQLGRFQDLVGQATALFADAWDAISPQNLPGLLDSLPALARRAKALFDGVVEFAGTVIEQVLALIKDSLLGMLSEHAAQVPGFTLLTVILGRNPFTSAPVARTPAALIGGFIQLLPGGAETFRELSESGVIEDAAARIESEMERLDITWDLVTETFRAIWDGFTLEDLLDPFGAIQRVIEQFGEPLGRIVSFVATVVQVVVELVLRLMNVPTELLAGIIAGITAAINDITADPVGFLKNLVATLKAGFERFFDHILPHLVAGLAGWLFRGLRDLGIQPPTEVNGAAILDLVLQVLGLSEDFLWERLAVAVGPERVEQIRGALGMLGEAWSFVSDVRERGLIAVWEMVSERLSGLWDMILDTARDWLMTNLIQAAITKVLSFLDPTGIMAVVNSAIAFFRAVQSVIDYATELLLLVKSYVDTLAAIARGDIEPGAMRLEHGLADAIPMAIGFLANQVGLGNVPEKVVEIIGRLRQVITEAIDWLIAQALRLGAAALRAVQGGGTGEDAAGRQEQETPEDVPETAVGIDITVSTGGGVHHLRDDGPAGTLVVHSTTVVLDSIANPDLRALLAAFFAAQGKEAKEAAALKVAAWVEEYGPGGGPGEGAPNIGAVGRHGRQPPRLTNIGVPLWSMQSEHVVPFMVVRKLWEALGVQGVAPRRILSTVDNRLTTILIYQGAATAKNTEEQSRRKETADLMEQMTQEYAELGNAQGPPDTPAADAEFRKEVIRVLRSEQVWYTDLTWTQIVEENHTVVGLSTHGQLRGEKDAPVPTRTQVAQAAQQEIDEADRILDEALAESIRPNPAQAAGPDGLTPGAAGTTG